MRLLKFKTKLQRWSSIFMLQFIFLKAKYADCGFISWKSRSEPTEMKNTQYDPNDDASVCIQQYIQRTIADASQNIFSEEKLKNMTFYIMSLSNGCKRDDERSKCPPTIEAVTILFAKLTTDVEGFQQTIQHFQNTNYNAMATVEKLWLLGNISARLDFLGREAATEARGECLDQLRAKVQAITYNITALEDIINEYNQKNVIKFMIQAILTGLDNPELENAFLVMSKIERDKAICAVMKTILPFEYKQQFLNNRIFESILTFGKKMETYSTGVFETILEFLIDNVKFNTSLSSLYIFRLAYEANRNPQNQLRHKFTDDIQNIFWENKLCIQNVNTSRLLVVRTDTNADIIKYALTGNYDGVNSCTFKWEIYPVLQTKSDRVQFVIRPAIDSLADQSVNEQKSWNLMELNNRVVLSKSDSISRFWTFEADDTEKSEFTLMTNVKNIPYFICTGEGANATTYPVTLIQNINYETTISRLCHWTFWPDMSVLRTI